MYWEGVWNEVSCLLSSTDMKTNACNAKTTVACSLCSLCMNFSTCGKYTYLLIICIFLFLRYHILYILLYFRNTWLPNNIDYYLLPNMNHITKSSDAYLIIKYTGIIFVSLLIAKLLCNLKSVRPSVSILNIWIWIAYLISLAFFSHSSSPGLSRACWAASWWSTTRCSFFSSSSLKLYSSRLSNLH